MTKKLSHDDYRLRPRAMLLAALAAGLLGACASPQHKAPVEDRGVIADVDLPADLEPPWPAA